MRIYSALLASAVTAAALTSGCGTINSMTAPSPIDRSGAAGSQSCDASKAQWAIGQRATDELLEEARAAAGARTARFLRPNQPITMEYFGWRLNLGLNEQDVVRSANCG
jgi:uncharacterized protein YceK